MGEALLQKTYTVDFLTKKRVKNNGQAAQYYVENSHPPIVSKEDFAAVQIEFERRSSMRGYSKTGKSKFTSDYAFSGKLFCQNCGSKFRRTKWGKGKNQQIVWICINHQMGGNEACNMKTVKEKALFTIGHCHICHQCLLGPPRLGLLFVFHGFGRRLDSTAITSDY